MEAAAERMYAALPAEMKVLDTAQTHNLFEGNAALMAQALTMFVNTARPAAGAMESALAARDYDAFHRTVHQTKGGAGYMGAERVQHLAALLQSESNELKTAAAAAKASGAPPPEPPLEFQARARTLSRCLQELLAELEQLISRTPAA